MVVKGAHNPLPGTANSTRAMIAAMALIGFGGGNCQLAAFALPELLPNKWRPMAVVMAGKFPSTDFPRLQIRTLTQHRFKHHLLRYRGTGCSAFRYSTRRGSKCIGILRSRKH